MGLEGIGSAISSAASSASRVADRVASAATSTASAVKSTAGHLVADARQTTSSAVSTATQPVENVIGALRQAATPVAQGAALRALDIAAGGRERVAEFLANDNRDGRVSDKRDDARTSGRDTVRPGKGDGPALPGKIVDGGGMPGYPVPPAAPKKGDGSKVHGSDDAGIKDHFIEDLCYRMADAADTLGLDNAARNLRHYLENSGDPLKFNANELINDIPAIKQDVDNKYQTQVVDVAKQKIAAEYDGKPMKFTITTPWNGAYATQDQSKDWFFATGGFSYAHTATVTVTPGKNGEAQVHIESNVHTFDRYNWDAGKSVDIGPIHIEDKAMGRLHEVGLAQEFELHGSGRGQTSDFTMKP